VITAEPGVPLSTDPLEEPIAAKLASLLLQVPPVVASASMVVRPEHMEETPVIADIGLTVTTAIAEHPVSNVYVMVAVPGVVTTPPVIVPEAEPIGAMVVLLLVHVPPPPSVNVVVVPRQTLNGPDMAEAAGFTVSVATRRQPVGNV